MFLRIHPWIACYDVKSVFAPTIFQELEILVGTRSGLLTMEVAFSPCTFMQLLLKNKEQKRQRVYNEQILTYFRDFRPQADFAGIRKLVTSSLQFFSMINGHLFFIFQFSQQSVNFHADFKGPRALSKQIMNTCFTGEISRHLGTMLLMPPKPLAISTDTLIIMTWGGGGYYWYLRRQMQKMLLNIL